MGWAEGIHPKYQGILCLGLLTFCILSKLMKQQQYRTGRTMKVSVFSEMKVGWGHRVKKAMSKVLPGSKASMEQGVAEGHHLTMPGPLQKHVLTLFLPGSRTIFPAPSPCFVKPFIPTSLGMVKLTVTLWVSKCGDGPVTVLEERIGWCPVMLGLGQEAGVP